MKFYTSNLTKTYERRSTKTTLNKLNLQPEASLGRHNYKLLYFSRNLLYRRVPSTIKMSNDFVHVFLELYMKNSLELLPIAVVPYVSLRRHKLMPLSTVSNGSELHSDRLLTNAFMCPSLPFIVWPRIK